MNKSFYKQGYDTGKNWANDYRPGGPWVCNYTNPRYAKLAARTKAENKEWLLGFASGLEQQRVFKRLKK